MVTIDDYCASQRLKHLRSGKVYHFLLPALRVDDISQLPIQRLGIKKEGIILNFDLTDILQESKVYCQDLGENYLTLQKLAADIVSAQALAEYRMHSGIFCIPVGMDVVYVRALIPFRTKIRIMEPTLIAADARIIIPARYAIGKHV